MRVGGGYGTWDMGHGRCLHACNRYTFFLSSLYLYRGGLDGGTIRVDGTDKWIDG